jgi:hypothetical protein
VPASFTASFIPGAGRSRLGAAPEPDFQYFRVYRGSTRVRPGRESGPFHGRPYLVGRLAGFRARSITNSPRSIMPETRAWPPLRRRP